MIDNEVSDLINYAYLVGRIVLENCRHIILDSSSRLRVNKKIVPKELDDMIRESYPDVLKLKDIFSV